MSFFKYDFDLFYDIEMANAEQPFVDIIDRFRGKWMWNNISRNSSLNIYFIKYFESELNWKILSLNSCLTPEIIRKFAYNSNGTVGGRWNWKFLTMNDCLTVEIIREFEDKWDWDLLYHNSCLTYEIFYEFKHKFGFIDSCFAMLPFAFYFQSNEKRTLKEIFQTEKELRFTSLYIVPENNPDWDIRDPIIDLSCEDDYLIPFMPEKMRNKMKEEKYWKDFSVNISFENLTKFESEEKLQWDIISRTFNFQPYTISNIKCAR